MLEAVGFYITQKLKRGELDELLNEWEKERRKIAELRSTFL